MGVCLIAASAGGCTISHARFEPLRPAADLESSVRIARVSVQRLGREDELLLQLAVSSRRDSTLILDLRGTAIRTFLAASNSLSRSKVLTALTRHATADSKDLGYVDSLPAIVVQDSAGRVVSISDSVQAITLARPNCRFWPDRLCSGSPEIGYVYNRPFLTVESGTADTVVHLRVGLRQSAGRLRSTHVVRLRYTSIAAHSTIPLCRASLWTRRGCPLGPPSVQTEDVQAPPTVAWTPAWATNELLYLGSKDATNVRILLYALSTASMAILFE
jgi:hypothetical protein